MKYRTGCLIKRNNRYSVRIMIEGKVITRALKKPDGSPCTTIADANSAKMEYVKLFILGSKRDALKALIHSLSEVEAEIDEIRCPRPALDRAWKSYLSCPDRTDCGEHTLREYERYCRLFIDWAKAHYPKTVFLADVTKSMAGEYAQHLAKENYSNSSFNKHTFFLRLLFRALCEGQPNPFSRVRNKPANSIPHRPLTQEQLAKVLGATKGELHTLLVIGTYTALRLKDACNLRWDQLDMDKSTITVTPSKTATRSGKQIRLPIHPVLSARLLTLPHKAEYVLPYMQWRYSNDGAVISKRIRKAFEAAGLVTRVKENGRTATVYSFHSLRFTMGQLLISSGFSLDTIAQVLGHSSTTMSRHYSNVTDAVRERAILSLPAITT